MPLSRLTPSLAVVLATLVAAGAKAAPPPSGTEAGSAVTGPNVVLFIADDVSWNDFGCYGHPAARTPHIDALAAGGRKYTNAFLTASSCSPSRASVITGRYPHNTGAAGELHRPIPEHLAMFPELLSDAGYFTALAGKNHMQRPGPDPFDRTATNHVPGNSGGHGRWVEFVRDRPRDRPFFFWFAALDAHRDWDADRQWDEAAYGPKHRPEDMVVPPFLADTPATRRDLASYHNEVTRFDHHIGLVVEELRRQGTLDETLILVMADNGRPFPRAKTRLHDSGMKTAFVAHWPNGIARAGASTDALVSAIDIAPTVLALAGVAAPAQLQGVDLSPTFADPAAEVRRFAFSEHNWHDYEAHGRSVRTADGWLYIRNARPEQAWQGPADSVRSPSHQNLRVVRDAGGLTPAQADVFLAPRPEEELYFTPDDPDQLSTLVGRPAAEESLKQLRSVMDDWQERTGDTVPDDYSRDFFDRESGDQLKMSGEGESSGRSAVLGDPAGAARGADRINDPGPR